MRVNILQTEICEATLLNEARNQTLKQKQKVNKHQFNVVILSVDKCYNCWVLVLTRTALAALIPTGITERRGEDEWTDMAMSVYDILALKL